MQAEKQNIGYQENRLFFRRIFVEIAENWSKSPKIGQIRRKLVKIAKNWSKSPKIGQNLKKLLL
jgi:hypothetical protein